MTWWKGCSRGREREEGKAGLRRRARVACGWMVFLGKFAARSPTLWIVAGDKYHMELRGSPLECAGPRAHRNVSLQMENVHSCYLGDLSLSVHLCLFRSVSDTYCQHWAQRVCFVITIHSSYDVAHSFFFLCIVYSNSQILYLCILLSCSWPHPLLSCGYPTIQDL